MYRYGIFYFRMLGILLVAVKGLRVCGIDIFVNCSWVDTRWQQYSTHLHTNSTQNNAINLGRVRVVPRL